MLKLVGPHDVQPGLPAMVKLAEVEVSEINVLVVALGFEDRTVACLGELAARHITVDHAVVWEYPGQVADNELNRPELTRLLQSVGARVEYASDHEDLVDLIRDRLAKLPAAATVAVDFSVMTGRLALACIDALSRAVEGTNMRVLSLYAEADEYLPSREAFERSHDEVNASGSFGHDEGVLTVDTTANLRGSHDPQLRDLVLVFPGFSRDRVRAAISYVNPALLMSADKNVRWALSVPHLEKDQWREQAMRDIHGITEGDIVNPVSTFEYREVYEYLERLFDEQWLESNLTIVFLGSKLQALAVGLFCIVRRGVRVVISAPETYKSDSYTRGVRELWAIDFLDWPATVRQLGMVGTVQFVD